MRYHSTRSDATFLNGPWNNLKPVNELGPSTLKIFANVRNELTSVDGNIVLLGNRIVIPDALRETCH